MVLKLIDKAWFRAKEIINPPSYDKAYEDGYNMALRVVTARFKHEMQMHTMHDWSSQEMQLGYLYGTKVVDNTADMLKESLSR